MALEDDNLRWTGRTSGGYFGNWFFIQTLRAFGLRAALAPLTPICAYYLLAHRRAVKCSMEFLAAALGPCPPARGYWRTYKHFYSLGMMLLERFAIVAGQGKFVFDHDGDIHIKNALDRGRGLIILGAHVGNWEAAGHLMSRYEAVVNVVGFDRERKSIKNLFASRMGNRKFNFIAAGGDEPMLAIPVLSALRRGEIVALHGDRIFGGATLKANFLGRPASFPVGAYRLAAISGAPLAHAFSAREKFGFYRLIAYPAMTCADRGREGRAEFEKTGVELYARRLEELVRRYPFQWYNFYPFWD